MKTEMYDTLYGMLKTLTIKEIRAFKYIELGVQNGDDDIYIDINKKQAVEIFKKLNFIVVYTMDLENDTLRIN